MLGLFYPTASSAGARHSALRARGPTTAGSSDPDVGIGALIYFAVEVIPDARLLSGAFDVFRAASIRS
jgi:hypothetical protein